MKKQLLAVISAVVVVGSGVAFSLTGNSPAAHSNIQGANQTAGSVSTSGPTNSVLAGIPITDGTGAVGVNTSAPANQSANQTTENPGETQATTSTTATTSTPDPTPVTQPVAPKKIVDRRMEYRDSTTRPDMEDAYCIYTYDDGSTGEIWSGARPKENSQRYQIQCGI